MVQFEPNEEEQQVIKFVFLLKKLKEIAELLKTSLATTKRILDKLYIKIGNADRLALILWAQKNGFVYDEDNKKVYYNGNLI